MTRTVRDVRKAVVSFGNAARVPARNYPAQTDQTDKRNGACPCASRGQNRLTSVCEDALYELATAGFMTKETSFLIGEKVSVLTVSFLFKVFLGNEPKGGRVDAIPQPCRRGTVREDMPEVGIGVFASHLGTDRE